MAGQSQCVETMYFDFTLSIPKGCHSGNKTLKSVGTLRIFTEYRKDLRSHCTAVTFMSLVKSAGFCKQKYIAVLEP